MLTTSSQIKELDGDEAGTGVGGDAAVAATSAQASYEDRTERTVCARLALIMAGLSAREAEAAMKRLKVSKAEIKRVLHHKKLLGQLPSPARPGS